MALDFKADVFVCFVFFPLSTFPENGEGYSMFAEQI